MSWSTKSIVDLALGSAPASGAVRRASRLTRTLEMDSTLRAVPRAPVRREAHRTAAEAAALPEGINRVDWAEARAPGARLRRRAFTLLEVMIAVGVLFMCLFGVLALLSNSLASARKLQQHRDIDTGSIAGLIYVELINTNSLNEGPVDVDLEEMYPGSTCHADLTQVGTNGLCQVDFDVERFQKVEAQSHFYIYLPNMKVGGISRGLPQH